MTKTINNIKEPQPKFKINEKVIVSKMIGFISEIHQYANNTYGYVVVSKDHMFLEDYIIEEKAISPFIEEKK